ncbi:MAG: UbiX family flavin prenyltransferase [Spirochaetales bacterium]|uniref:Flavin prenyltransferase UbiX n=1 Tax=Candidatus Thalassospirochaeta sargassi TaxID=3119039 RepID=A0AAJ1IFW0_9SPIO|nr:UbiX family flavin prenyltransferase [Spirochaetales bacterium]
MNKIIIGITGASGSVYAVRLIEELCSHGKELHLIFSETGTEVFRYETGISPEEFIGKLNTPINKPTLHSNTDIFAPPASGSFIADAMVIVPCSMATLGSIANGSLRSLLGRSADVCFKERRKIIIVPRETPFSRIHLKNMLELTDAGAVILPAMPAFYNHPETVNDIVDFTVARILDQLNVENSMIKRWNGQEPCDHSSF